MGEEKKFLDKSAGEQWTSVFEYISEAASESLKEQAENKKIKKDKKDARDKKKKEDAAEAKRIKAEKKAAEKKAAEKKAAEKKANKKNGIKKIVAKPAENKGGRTRAPGSKAFKPQSVLDEKRSPYEIKKDAKIKKETKVENKKVNAKKVKKVKENKGKNNRRFTPISLADEKRSPYETKTKVETKVKPKKSTTSFGKAFADARGAGKKTFMWNGKSYNTKRADDKAAVAPIKKLGEIAPKHIKTTAELGPLTKKTSTAVKKEEPKKEEPKKEETPVERGKKQMERARKSMGFKKGGRVGGKCKVDGIAIRGRTRAKHK